MIGNKNTYWIFWILGLIIPVFLLISACDKDNDVQCTTIGAPCDDGNDDTYNDAYNADCECEGNLNLFTDPRDGNQYRVVKIGTQIWFAENLKYEPATGDHSCYGNSDAHCDTYGRLYDWSTSKTVAPYGWHLPSAGEWAVLSNYLGGDNVAGGKLKEEGLAHWANPNSDATNESGFTGLPAGSRWNGVGFISLGTYGSFWSSTESVGVNLSLARRLVYNNGEFVNLDGISQYDALSVRCIRD